MFLLEMERIQNDREVKTGTGLQKQLLRAERGFEHTNRVCFGGAGAWMDGLRGRRGE